MNVGFYPGDDKVEAFFYGYIFPQPDGAATLPLAPATAAWSDAIKEWVLPSTTRSARQRIPGRRARCVSRCDPYAAVAAPAAGWDRTALSYVAPKRVSRT